MAWGAFIALKVAERESELKAAEQRRIAARYDSPMWAPTGRCISAEDASQVSLALRSAAQQSEIFTLEDAMPVPSADGDVDGSNVYIAGQLAWKDHQRRRKSRVCCMLLVPNDVASDDFPSFARREQLKPHSDGLSQWGSSAEEDVTILSKSEQLEAASLLAMEGVATALDNGFLPVGLGLLKQVRSALMKTDEDTTVQPPPMLRDSGPAPAPDSPMLGPNGLSLLRASSEQRSPASSAYHAARLLWQAALQRAAVCHTSVLMRGILGEQCEALHDWEGAIRAYLDITTSCQHLLLPLGAEGPGYSRCAAYGMLALAFKRSGRCDHAERLYREALRDVPADCNLTEAQNVRWNLFHLVSTDSNAGDTRKLRDAGFALFGGEDAARQRLVAMQKAVRDLHHGLVDLDLEIYHPTSIVCRLRVDGLRQSPSLLCEWHSGDVREISSEVAFVENEPVLNILEPAAFYSDDRNSRN